MMQYLFNEVGKPKDSSGPKLGEERIVRRGIITVTEEYVDGGTNGWTEKILGALAPSRIFKLPLGAFGKALDYENVYRVQVTYEAFQKQVYVFEPLFVNGELVRSSYFKDIGEPILGKELHRGIPRRYEVHSFDDRKNLP
jgi:hypothetical protein